MRNISHVLVGWCADGCGAVRYCCGREAFDSPLDREVRKEIAEMAASGMKLETVTIDDFNARCRNEFDKCRTPAPEPRMASAGPLFGERMEGPSGE